MRKPVLLIFTNACILILVFTLLAQSLWIVQRVAVMRHATGRVEVQRGGAGVFAPLRAGEGLKSGDIVATGAASVAEFAWGDGTRWQLAADSLLCIERAQFNASKKAEISRFRLEKGRILVRVVRPMSSQSRFEIETPGALASVRGTIFSVAAARGTTKVKVFRGSVEVSDAGGTRHARIAPGQSVRAWRLGFKASPDADTADFLAQPTFLRPELSSRARRVSRDEVLISGQTEAGDTLTLDGAPVRVLGTGAFLKRFKTSPNSLGWKLESTDKHGAKTVIWQRPPALSDGQK